MKRVPHRELPPIPHFRALIGDEPYPWQRRLYMEFVAGRVPVALAIPTGLGKTASVLLAVLARLANPAVPRRVVYIVDRRAIVDQTAAAIRGWIDRIGAVPELARAFARCAAFPAACPVGLGVLRGGSRTTPSGGWIRLVPRWWWGRSTWWARGWLFSGYGAGRSRRAMDAGLVGHDALIVLDERTWRLRWLSWLRALAQLHPELPVMTLSALGGGVPALC